MCNREEVVYREFAGATGSRCVFSLLWIVAEVFRVYRRYMWWASRMGLQ